MCVFKRDPCYISVGWIGEFCVEQSDNDIEGECVVILINASSTKLF